MGRNEQKARAREPGCAGVTEAEVNCSVKSGLRAGVGEKRFTPRPLRRCRS